MLQVGQILHDRYQLQQKLGQNAGRQTWLAHDLQAKSAPPQLVVVKLLSFGGDVQWDDLKLFEREAQVLQQLDHPRIPQYRDYFAIDDRTLWFGMVQTYIPGIALKDWLTQSKRLTEDQVKAIALDLLAILQYLHTLNPPVLHRDIKPSNLIWGEDEQVYLVDFGAVQDRATTEGATFTVVGTYGYAPIEQFGGRTVPASDLYALGATLIHLLTDTAPADLPQRNLQMQFRDRATLSPAFANWLQKLTAPALENRFSTAAEARNYLESGQDPTPVAEPVGTLTNTSGQGQHLAIPPEIRGWNWGAFWLAPYWSLANRTWIGLWCLLFPSLGFWLINLLRISSSPVALIFYSGGFLLELSIMGYLGKRGNPIAWQNIPWHSISQFQAHQRRWAIAGLLLGAPIYLVSVLSRLSYLTFIFRSW
jgi:serine/threonine protein kinase